MTAELTWLANMLLTSALGVVAISLRMVEKSWLAPGAFFCGFWLSATTVCLVVAPEFPVYPGALAWMVLAGICVGLGSVFGGAIAGCGIESPAIGVGRARLEAAHFTIVGATLMGLGGVWVLVRWIGAPATDSDWIQGLAAMASEATVRRYSGENEPRLAVVLITAVYFGCLVSGGATGMATSSLTRVSRAILILPFVPAVAISIVLTTKASLLFALTFWASGYFAGRACSGRDRFFAGGLLIRTPLLLLAGLSVFWALTAWRYGTAVSEFSDLLPTVKVSLFGSLAVFSSWFESAWSEQASLGATTFAGVAGWFGLPERISGLFEGGIDLAGSESNVYTAFRVLIGDFTATGALIVLGALGFCYSLAYQFAKRGGVTASAILSSYYVIVLWSPITMATVYNSVLLALAAYWIYCVCTSRARAQPYTSVVPLR